MNYNELEQKADLVWSTLNNKENADKTKREQMNLIKNILLQMAEEQREVGRNQIKNLISETIKSI
jgi:hypothetical protein